MPSVADIDWDVLPDADPKSPSGHAAKSASAADIDWDVIPDDTQRTPTFLGELGRSAAEPFKSLAKSPTLLTMSDDEWLKTIQEESAKRRSVAQPGIAATAGRIAGSVVGGVGQFVGSEAAGTTLAAETGPAAPFIGLGAAAASFGASSAYETGISAGVRAYDQGLPKDKVVSIAKKMAGIGAGVGAATAIALPGSVSGAIEKSIIWQGGELIPRTATALSQTLKTAAGGATVGTAGQLIENVAEKEMGLDVSPTEGLLEQAVVMGLLPVVAHAKDLYRQARSVAKSDPAKAKALQKEADDVAGAELRKVDTTPASETNLTAEQQAKESAKAKVREFVMGSELPTPKGATAPKAEPPAAPETVTPDQAKSAKDRMSREATGVAGIEKESTAAVPSTEPEAELGINVLDEIKQSGARTIADIQRLFPQAQLSREAARKLRDQAWGKPEAPAPKSKPAPTETPEDLTAQMESETVMKGDVQPQSEQGAGEVPAEESGPGIQSRADQTPESETPAQPTTDPPTITVEGPAGDWSYETLKALSVAQRGKLAGDLRRYTKDARLTDKAGLLELGPKKISEVVKDLGERKIREAQEKASKPVESPPVEKPVENVTTPVTDETKAETQQPAKITPPSKEPESPSNPQTPEKAVTKAENEILKSSRTTKEAKNAKLTLISEIEAELAKAKPASDVLGAVLREKGIKAESNAEKFAKQLSDAAKAGMLPTIDIDIPGDGEFTIVATKEALTEALTRAKRLATTPGSRKAQSLSVRERFDYKDEANKLATSKGSAWKAAAAIRKQVDAMADSITEEDRVHYEKMVDALLDEGRKRRSALLAQKTQYERSIETNEGQLSKATNSKSKSVLSEELANLKKGQAENEAKVEADTKSLQDENFTVEAYGTGKREPPAPKPRSKAGQYAVPSGQGSTVESAKAEVQKAFGKVSDRISFEDEPDNPYAARIDDRNRIVVNVARTAPGTVERVLLEEGLHGVWNEPELARAWKSFKDAVTEYDIAAERSKRADLDTDRETLKEEAAISKLLNRPDSSVARRLWDTIISALDRLFGVKPQSREQLIEAARNFLTGETVSPEHLESIEHERFASPTTSSSKAPIEQYTDELKKIDGEKIPPSEKVKQSFDLGGKVSSAKDAFGKALNGLKTAGDYVRHKFSGINSVDELLRNKGQLSKELETRGWRIRQWEKAAKNAVPRARDQAAIAKWLDAGGDADELRRGAAETKPEFRQAYEDALNLKPDMLKVAQEAQQYFEKRLDEAIDAGVLKEGIEDYIHRMYESRPQQRDKAIASVQNGLIQPNPSLAKHRIFQFDWEAEKAGYKPVQSFIERIAQYESSLSKAIASREFIRSATELTANDGRPVVDIKGVGIPLENEFGVKKPDGTQFKTTFNTRESADEFARRNNSEVVTLDPKVRAGTIIKPQFNPSKSNNPGTLNYRGDYVNKEFPSLSKWKWVSSDSAGKPIFVQGDVAIHPEFVHRINALLEPSRVRYGRYGSILRPALAVSSAFKQTMLDLSGFHQVQITVHGMEHKVMPWNIVKDIDFQNPNVSGLLKGGVTLGGDYHYSREGLVGASLTRQIPVLGPILESYHQWLFQDYIPRIKMTMALKALERNRERYAGKLSEEQIFNKTAMQANSAFGELNYIMLERSKTAQDMARLIFLAPDFLEARGRFAAEALSKGGRYFGNEQRTALFLGAATLYTTARVLNKLTDDQYHWEPENMFSWVNKGQAYSLRTVQGDILHLLEKPLSFWMHRLNPVFGRSALELATQRDEFGRKRSVPQIAWDTVSTITPISLRSNRERTMWESLANAFGITDRRWQDTDKAFSLARDWKDKHGIGERGEFIYDPDKDPLRNLKIALSRQDDSGAAAEIKKLLASNAYTMQSLDSYFKRYGQMPFTGSRAHDKQWESGLTEDQKKTVEAARQHKQQIWRLYLNAKGQYRQAASSG